MAIGNQALVSLVAKVNVPLVLITWPFVLYEVFAKNPGIPDLKGRVDLRRSQLLGLVVHDLADRVSSYWPKSPTRIIVEQSDVADWPLGLSDDAIDEMKECLESSEKLLWRAIRLRHISAKVLTLDRWCYWLIFSTGVESLGALVVWFFTTAMSGQIAMALIGLPILTAGPALICAGVRQGLIHSAHEMIVSADD